jgi:hypothetical protein
MAKQNINQRGWLSFVVAAKNDFLISSFPRDGSKLGSSARHTYRRDAGLYGITG